MSSAAMVFPGLRKNIQFDVLQALRDKRVDLPSRLIRKACELYQISEVQLFAKTRRSQIIEPRHACMYILSQHCGFKLKFIGKQIFKRFDHTTVIHARNRVQNMIDTEEKTRDNISFLLEAIGL